MINEMDQKRRFYNSTYLGSRIVRANLSISKLSSWMSYRTALEYITHSLWLSDPKVEIKEEKNDLTKINAIYILKIYKQALSASQDDNKESHYGKNKLFNIINKICIACTLPFVFLSFLNEIVLHGTKLRGVIFYSTLVLSLFLLLFIPNFIIINANAFLLLFTTASIPLMLFPIINLLDKRGEPGGYQRAILTTPVISFLLLSVLPVSLALTGYLPIETLIFSGLLSGILLLTCSWLYRYGDKSKNQNLINNIRKLSNKIITLSILASLMILPILSSTGALHLPLWTSVVGPMLLWFPIIAGFTAKLGFQTIRDPINFGALIIAIGLAVGLKYSNMVTSPLIYLLLLVGPLMAILGELKCRHELAEINRHPTQDPELMDLLRRLENNSHHSGQSTENVDRNLQSTLNSVECEQSRNQQREPGIQLTTLRDIECVDRSLADIGSNFDELRKEVAIPIAPEGAMGP